MNNDLGLLRSLGILFTYRRRLLEAVSHDVRQRYVGSVFGSMWAFVYPALQLGIYGALYVFILRVRPQGLTETGYVVLVFSGLVPLMAFNEAVSTAMTSLSGSKTLLLNTVFPAELIPVRAVLTAQTSGVIALCFTLGVGIAAGRTGWNALLFAPILWILLLMFATGLGWILALVSLVARDVQHAMGLIMMLLLLLSPFAYTPSMVPEQLKLILYLNPLSYFVLAFQQVICYGAWPGIVPATGAVVLAVGGFLAGFSVFRRAKHIFFDYV